MYTLKTKFLKNIKMDFIYFTFNPQIYAIEGVTSRGFEQMNRNNFGQIGKMMFCCLLYWLNYISKKVD